MAQVCPTRPAPRLPASVINEMPHAAVKLPPIETATVSIQIMEKGSDPVTNECGKIMGIDVNLMMTKECKECFSSPMTEECQQCWLMLGIYGAFMSCILSCVLCCPGPCQVVPTGCCCHIVGYACTQKGCECCCLPVYGCNPYCLHCCLQCCSLCPECTSNTPCYDPNFTAACIFPLSHRFTHYRRR